MKHCTICGHQAEPDGQLQCACGEPKVDSMAGSVFSQFADMCSCGCNRVSRLDSVHKTAVGIVPLYLCRYCKAVQTRARKQNDKVTGEKGNHDET